MTKKRAKGKAGALPGTATGAPWAWECVADLERDFVGRAARKSREEICDYAGTLPPVGDDALREAARAFMKLNRDSLPSDLADKVAEYLLRHTSADGVGALQDDLPLPEPARGASATLAFFNAPTFVAVMRKSVAAPSARRRLDRALGDDVRLNIPRLDRGSPGQPDP